MIPVITNNTEYFIYPDLLQLCKHFITASFGFQGTVFWELHFKSLDLGWSWIWRKSLTWNPSRMHQMQEWQLILLVCSVCLLEMQNLKHGRYKILFKTLSKNWTFLQHQLEKRYSDLWMLSNLVPPTRILSLQYNPPSLSYNLSPTYY